MITELTDDIRLRTLARKIQNADHLKLILSKVEGGQIMRSAIFERIAPLLTFTPNRCWVCQAFADFGDAQCVPVNESGVVQGMDIEAHFHPVCQECWEAQPLIDDGPRWACNNGNYVRPAQKVN